MSKQVILNLPVKDIEKSKAFFSQMGLSIDSNLTDEHATCFVVAENVVVALLPEPHFKEASMGEMADASKANEVLISIGADSREEVDSLVGNAIKAGGLELHEPADMDTIYGRSFADLDHHKWNVFYMHGNK
ncbi:MAG: Glyoxalase/bleomycin resistance protein/dioxygenase [Candidatus Adlerbacteria bacterium]|nr:Glyoxalase/bleomycin resistance protein/dioxygenase [Candidatus Adlerbacteria bacterium]